MMPRPTIVAAVLFSTIVLSAAQSGAQTTMPSYPPTREGLTQFFKEMLDASDKQDARKLLLMSQSLMLPKPQVWFKEMFGDEAGPKLAAAYEKDMTGFPPGLAKLFLNINTPKELIITITRVETPDDPNVKLQQAYALQTMRNPVPLYSVTIAKEKTTATIGLWSFVYADGGFRLVGKMLNIREIVKTPQ